MPGPLSTPNGDETIIRGHVNEVFLCRVHGENRLDDCADEIAFATWPGGRKTNCKIIPLREYLLARNRLVTGKTT